ncbi:hypothetical protein DPMN_087053 [Dreissena polymorpha]|uniref:Uncharacterized protein n=1 Tax=Dreissena polymorpha TaxID=45954 RepID=A0A9D4KRZ4_DREPO|nr:hypothetical protein DPMN_087053 [Dreissena polymorpha]
MIDYCCFSGSCLQVIKLELPGAKHPRSHGRGTINKGLTIAETLADQYLVDPMDTLMWLVYLLCSIVQESICISD